MSQPHPQPITPLRFSISTQPHHLVTHICLPHVFLVIRPHLRPVFVHCRCVVCQQQFLPNCVDVVSPHIATISLMSRAWGRDSLSSTNRRPEKLLYCEAKVPRSTHSYFNWRFVADRVRNKIYPQRRRYFAFAWVFAIVFQSI